MGSERNLEDMIGNHKHPNFKSEGERRIANFLEDTSIRYHYEPGILIHSDDDKPRIWYPDFYLPEFGAYIEYYGLVGRQNYDRGIKRKERVYSKMSLTVIPVYPWTFAENWQGYIMEELERTTVGRYRTLMSKPYWSRDSARDSASSYTRSRGPHQAYRPRPNKLY